MKNNTLILIFLFISFSNTEAKTLSNDIYILNNNSIQNVPRTFLSFYENSNYNISLNNLPFSFSCTLPSRKTKSG